jgi:hypothetical protein
MGTTSRLRDQRHQPETLLRNEYLAAENRETDKMDQPRTSRVWRRLGSLPNYHQRLHEWHTERAWLMIFWRRR